MNGCHRMNQRSSTNSWRPRWGRRPAPTRQAPCDLFLQKVFMKVLDLNVRMISRTLDQRKEVILKKWLLLRRCRRAGNAGPCIELDDPHCARVGQSRWHFAQWRRARGRYRVRSGMGPHERDLFTVSRVPGKPFSLARGTDTRGHRLGEGGASVNRPHARPDSFAYQAHARNAHQVMGQDCRTPAAFLVCWTPDGAEDAASSHSVEATGGTRTAIVGNRVFPYSIWRGRMRCIDCKRM